MANYYSMGRTNHFAVKDPDAFEEYITPLVGDGDVIREERDGVDGFILLFPDGVPNYYDPEDGDSVELEWDTIIAPHLADGSVCVIQEIGNEKLRYLTGYAFAFNNKNESEYLNLNSIYKQAEHLGTHITEAEW